VLVEDLTPQKRQLVLKHKLNEELKREIAQRERAESRLAESEKKYREVVETAGDIIYQTDRRGFFTLVNPVGLKMTGYDEEELIGKSYLDLIPLDHRETVERFYGIQIVKRLSITYYEFPLVTKQGETIWLGQNVQLLTEDEAIVGFQVIARDVSKRKRADQEMESLREQLLQAHKMEAIGTLTGGIAHDFNNMLTIILGYSDLVLSNMDEQDSRSADVRKIIQTAKNGAELVRRLLTFSRKTPRESSSLEINVQIENTRKLLERVLPKMIDIQLNLQDKLALINADPIQIDQILMNLAINARDAMPDGGKLVVETKNVTLDENYCSAHVSVRPGNYVMLSISDTGHGMDEPTRSRIFDPFFTTKQRDSTKGTGLGLAVVHGIVDQQGGHIICESEPGKGSTFRIYFPAVNRVTASPDSVMDPLLDGRGEALLLVDDEEFVRDLGERILKRAGYKVITASNGKEALEIYGKAQGMIDLVILDLLMPEMGGQQCLRKLLTIQPGLKVLVASAHSDEDSLQESFDLGATGFVSKPFGMKELLRQVRQVLDEG